MIAEDQQGEHAEGTMVLCEDFRPATFVNVDLSDDLLHGT